MRPTAWQFRFLGIVQLLPIVMGSGCALSAQQTSSVTLTPGTDIQALVDASDEGTRFYLQPGIYRQQTIYPKDRQEFIGQDGVILSGAMVLAHWKKFTRPATAVTRPTSGIWIAENLPPPLEGNGRCSEGRSFCTFREDLFMNGRLYQRVGDIDDLGPGSWYYDDGRAYLADDPTGQMVELAVTPLAFGGEATAVVVKDLIVEKYASQAQEGAIDIRGGRDWLIAEVTARWNHSIGLYMGPRTHVKGGSFSHNGQLGIGGTGDRSTVESVEVAFNNYAGYSWGWEAGGTKFSRMQGLVVRDSCIHHNNGPGLWSDIDNVDVIYEGNIVFANGGDGIKHEISLDAMIYNNIVAHNGNGFDTWLWGSQILVQNSRNVRVLDNIVEIGPDGGNGISIVHQERGEGDYAPWNAVHNRVMYNTVVHLGENGKNGIARDADEDWFWREGDNMFDRNTYIVADEATEHWAFRDEDVSWGAARELGYEQKGELFVEERAAMELSCDR
jgi:hypothetical protein